MQVPLSSWSFAILFLATRGPWTIGPLLHELMIGSLQQQSSPLSLVAGPSPMQACGG